MKEKKGVQTEAGTEKTYFFLKQTKQVGELFGFERSQDTSKLCNLPSMKC